MSNDQRAAVDGEEFECVQCGEKKRGTAVHDPHHARAEWWAPPAGWFCQLSPTGVDVVCSVTCALEKLKW